MAAKYWTSKYGTRIDISGLSPEQVKRVQSKAQDNGAFGTAATQLATQFRKTTASKPVVSTPGAADPAGNTIINPNGTINQPGTQAELDARRNEDFKKSFNASNPDETDAYGNTVHNEIDPVTGKVTRTTTQGSSGKALTSFIDSYFANNKPLDLSGAPQVLTDNDLQSTRQGAYQSLYDQSTRNFARDKSRELEESKQELANRGIPFDPADPNSAYGRVVGAVDDKYHQYDLDAQNLAQTGADQRLATLVGANATARDSFINSATQQYNSGLNTAAQAANIYGTTFAPNSFAGYKGGSINSTDDLLTLAQTASNSELAAIGLDQDRILKLKQLAIQKQALNKPTGGGGNSGSSDSGFLIAGEAP